MHSVYQGYKRGSVPPHRGTKPDTTPEIQAERPGWYLWRDGVIPGDPGASGETVGQVGARADAVLARVRPLAGAGDARWCARACAARADRPLAGPGPADGRAVPAGHRTRACSARARPAGHPDLETCRRPRTAARRARSARDGFLADPASGTRARRSTMGRATISRLVVAVAVRPGRRASLLVAAADVLSRSSHSSAARCPLPPVGCWRPGRPPGRRPPARASTEARPAPSPQPASRGRLDLEVPLRARRPEPPWPDRTLRAALGNGPAMQHCVFIDACVLPVVNPAWGTAARRLAAGASAGCLTTPAYGYRVQASASLTHAKSWRRPGGP